MGATIEIIDVTEGDKLRFTGGDNFGFTEGDKLGFIGEINQPELNRSN